MDANPEQEAPEERPGRPDARRIAIWAVASLVLVSLLAPGLIGFGESAGPEAPSSLLGGRETVTSEAIPAGGALERLESRLNESEDASDFAASLSDAALDDESFDCIIEPSERVLVGSAETGVLKEIYFDRSDLVSAGDVLARLESDAEDMAYRAARVRAETDSERQSAEVSLELGARRQERATELFQGKALSLDLREEIETEARLAALRLTQVEESRRMARLKMRQAKAELQRREIRSPISGVVVDRLKAPGEVVKEEGIIEVVQVDPLRVEVVLPAALFGQVQPGMRAQVLPEPPADGTYIASIDLVDRVIDPASGTFGVRLGLPNPDHVIPSGLHCQVSFVQVESASR